MTKIHVPEFEKAVDALVEAVDATPAQVCTLLADRFARIVVGNTDERGDQAFVELVRNHLKRHREIRTFRDKKGAGS